MSDEPARGSTPIDGDTSPSLLRRKRRLLRVAFWCYAALLFTATHWPRLTLEVPGIERPDLFIHVSVFGTWTLLLLTTGYLWKRENWPTVKAALLGWVVALAYAAFDEGSQAIPFVHRTAAWDDYAANASGITAATLVGIAIARYLRRGGN